MQETAPVGRDLALKIDCEGCEWDVLDQLPEEQLARFKTITGEFHHMGYEARHPQMLRVMKKLTKHFRILHTHGCNMAGMWNIKDHDLYMPRVVEATLVRMDSSEEMSCALSVYNEELDHPVNGHFAEMRADAFHMLPGLSRTVGTVVLGGGEWDTLHGTSRKPACGAGTWMGIRGV